MIRSDARVILMDELTSSLDPHTDETAVRRLLQNGLADCTIPLLSTGWRASLDWDKVAVMVKGEFVEFDKPVGLMTKDSAVRKLWGGLPSIGYAFIVVGSGRWHRNKPAMRAILSGNCMVDHCERRDCILRILGLPSISDNQMKLGPPGHTPCCDLPVCWQHV